MEPRGTRSTSEDDTALEFLGIYPNTPDDGSPTIWRDTETGDLLIQSYKASEADIRAAQEVGSIPGHTTDIPDHEFMIRLPESMIQFIPRPENEDNSVGNSSP